MKKGFLLLGLFLFSACASDSRSSSGNSMMNSSGSQNMNCKDNDCPHRCGCKETCPCK